MLKDTEHLARQIILWNAVAMIEPRLRPPANVKSRLNIRLSPIHDVSQFIPVVHFLERHLLYRRACDDEAVEFFTVERVEGDVMIEQMFGIDVLGIIRCRVKKRDIHLQRRIAKEAKQLGFSSNLRGHEIQNRYAQRANVLMSGAFFTHDEDVFIFEGCACGKCGWNFYWHSPAFSPLP